MHSLALYNLVASLSDWFLSGCGLLPAAEMPASRDSKTEMCGQQSDTNSTAFLTTSLTQPLKFSGWICTDAPANSIFTGPLTSILNAMHFDKNCFTYQLEKRKQKGLRVSNFALLLVAFKWHHGSEGVKRPQASVQLHTKLYSNKEELEKTATFILQAAYRLSV